MGGRAGEVGWFCVAGGSADGTGDVARPPVTLRAAVPASVAELLAGRARADARRPQRCASDQVGVFLECL